MSIRYDQWHKRDTKNGAHCLYHTDFSSFKIHHSFYPQMPDRLPGVLNPDTAHRR